MQSREIDVEKGSYSKDRSRRRTRMYYVHERFVIGSNMAR